MAEGHIKEFRKIMNWEWYKDVNVAHLFRHCLLKANWKDGRFKGMLVPRGSFITSYAHLSEETGLSVQEIRTAIAKLKKSKNLTCTSTKKYTWINVVNFNDYQDVDYKINTQCNKQSTQYQQQYKNIKNNKNKYIYSNKTKSKTFANYTEDTNPNQNEIERINKLVNKWGVK